MALTSPQTRVRARRWVASAAALLALAAACWVALEHAGTRPEDAPPPSGHAAPGLDRHTPRVD